MSFYRALPPNGKGECGHPLSAVQKYTCIGKPDGAGYLCVTCNPEYAPHAIDAKDAE